jgi:hypothetical protein
VSVAVLGMVAVELGATVEVSVAVGVEVGRSVAVNVREGDSGDGRVEVPDGVMVGDTRVMVGREVMVAV